jgi:hypothetical protein
VCSRSGANVEASLASLVRVFLCAFICCVMDMNLRLQVTTLLLDKMRRIKNRMVRLKTRVETIRELLEKFLEDEGDMKSMNLTAR